MPTKKGKTISFDAMVKFFMQNYNIPTKKDVDKVMAKLDRLENLVIATMDPKLPLPQWIWCLMRSSGHDGAWDFPTFRPKPDLEIKRFVISFFD
jgi:hypothetical protein